MPKATVENAARGEFRTIGVVKFVMEAIGVQTSQQQDVASLVGLSSTGVLSGIAPSFDQ